LQKMKATDAISGLVTIIAGAIITGFLWWFFGSFGFWELPGLLILLVGIAEVLYKVFIAQTNQRSARLHGGLIIMFIGFASYLSFSAHIMLGVYQIISLAIIAIGIISTAIGMMTARKA